MTTTLTRTLRNDLAELGPLAAAVESYCEQHDLPPPVIFAANLVVEEMVSNVIKYGYDDEGPHEIEVSIGVNADRVVITVADDGHPFDPLAAPTPDTSVPLADRTVGGLGIHLVRKNVTSMRYRREANRNVLEMVIDRAEKRGPTLSP